MLPKYQQIADALRAQLAGEKRSLLTKLPTEKELCGLYGVSRQTVRQALHVLEGEGLIERRQGSGAYATGLRPDASHNQIAILLPTDSDYTFAKLRSDLQLPLAREGFSVSFYITEYSIRREREILIELCSMPLRGLIAYTVKNALPNPNLDLYEKLWAAHVPTVFLCAPYENFPPRPAITEDNVAGAMQLTSYLINGKHTHIGAILCSDTREGFERYLGFTYACIEAGIPFDDDYISWYGTPQLLALQKKQATGFLTDFIHYIYHIHQEKPGACSAIICQDDEIAYWLVKELTAIGIHVPEDMSVVSFDNSYLCDFSTPGLTSMAHSGPGLAASAADALLAQMRGMTPESVCLHFELIERDSSAPLA